jgi:hypothetical protein
MSGMMGKQLPGCVFWRNQGQKPPRLLLGSDKKYLGYGASQRENITLPG